MPGAASRMTGATKPALSKPPTSKITHFTRVSKSVSAQGKQASKLHQPVWGNTTNIEILIPAKKRRRDDDGDAFPTGKKACRVVVDEPAAVNPTKTTFKKKKTVTFADVPDKSTPPPCTTNTSKQSHKRRLDSSEGDCQPLIKPSRPAKPAKSAIRASRTDQPEVLLERLNIDSSPLRKRSRTSRRGSDENDASSHELPKDLLELLDLQAALLKTLTLQFAHNGTNAALDLVRVVCPSVTQAWGKRRVTIEDVRRCVGVMSWTPAKSVPVSAYSSSSSQVPFFLSDYGRGKVYLEMRSDCPAGLREHELNMDFEANLRTLWLAWGDHKCQDIQPFVASLPMAMIQACASLAKATPMYANGQRTLEELKNGIVRKQQVREDAELSPITTGSVTVNTNPKLSLLDRIRLKEQELAEAASQGPSPAELERRAALHRAEDVAAVVGMLSMAAGGAGRARISFTLTAVLLKLKDSLRTPISGEDGASCVRLLATEVAPEWMRVIKVGGRENVVVQPGFEPRKAVMQERVQALLA